MNPSVVVDETAETRRTAEDIGAAMADVSAQLADIPGWLKVGDPDRFADPADGDTARLASDLVAQLEDLGFELARNLQHLDQLLSTSPEEPLPAQPQYGVLLPVRLETRFVRPTDEDPIWRLRVRVEPDPVSLPAGGRAATAAEAEQVGQFWVACAGDLGTPAAEAAFAGLAGRVGAARAAYLLRAVAVDRDGDGFAVVPDQEVPPVPAVLGLPREIEIWGNAGAGMTRLATLAPDREQITGTFDLAAVQPAADGSIPRTWWNSYSEAERVGLARQIELDEAEPAFAVLLAIGINQPGGDEPRPRQLFDAHTAAGSLDTLAPLTPTNTVDGQPTIDLGRDPAPWLEVARQPVGTLAGLTVLSGRSAFVGVPAPDTARADTANALVRALWPVLWQRSFKDIADLGEDVYRLGEYAGRHLHPFGPFPVLRVGDLPYGVLPVSWYRNWSPVADDPPFEGTQVSVGMDVVDALADQVGVDLTAVDADVDRLLSVLAHTPSAREYGSRNHAPTALWAAFQAAIEGIDPADVVAAWDAQARLLLDDLRHAPRRRYSPLLFVEPWPDEVFPEYRKVMELYLDQSWGALAEVNDLGGLWSIDNLPPHPLARLVRQSLLLTNIEVCRLFFDGVPDPRPTSYLLPLNNPQQMFSDATGLEGIGLVRDLPQQAIDLVNGNTAPQLARYNTVVRQWEDVRGGVEQLIGTDQSVTDPVLTGVLDAAGHRADVWLTAAAHRRLRKFAAAGAEPILGCYGWVDDLRPSPDPTPPTRAGLVHAPSYTQALTAAVLRDHVVHDDTDDRWQMRLTSTTVRHAAELAEQVRSGIPLGEVLGREIERRVREPEQVLQLRTDFKARPEWAGRRVCDGEAVLDAAPADLPAFLPASDLDDLRDALEAYADLLVTDAVHDVVEGRQDAARESLDAAAGLTAPPELRLLRTPREGGTIRTDVAFVLRYRSGWEAKGTHPVDVADPAFARFLRDESGKPAKVTWTSATGSVSLRDLGLVVADLVVLPPSAVTALVVDRVGEPTGGNGPGVMADIGRLASMLGAPYQRGPGAADVLRGRLARLRTMAEALAASIAEVDARELRSWGLAEDPVAASDELASRLERIGPAATDAGADADALVERIRTLVATVQPLPLVCPDDVPAAGDEGTWLDDWLPVVAAVRPALAAVEAALLQPGRDWSGRGSRVDPWVAPPLGQHGIAGDLDTAVLIGPGVGRADGTGVVRLDSWAETSPSPRHTTWTAFGYDAPRARAPQSLLVVVPSFEERGVDLEEVRQAVLTTREMARARAVPVTPDNLAIGLPTGVVEAVGSAACTLTEKALP